MVKITAQQLLNIEVFFFGFFSFLFSNVLYDFIKTFLNEYLKVDKDNIRDQLFVIFTIFLLILFFILNINKIL